MADFKKALAYVLGNEGGLVDNPHDKGGLTKFGITGPTLSNYLNRPATREELIDLSLDDAGLIYKKLYWDTLELDDVTSDAVSTAIFDQAVNRGVHAARMLMARLGGAKINNEDPKQLVLNISKDAAYHYKSIVEHSPSQEVFLHGWINRANRLLTLV